MLGMELRRFRRVVGSVMHVPMSRVRVMRRRLVVARFVVLCRFAVMIRCVIVVLSRFMMMLRRLLGHFRPPSASDCGTAGDNLASLR